MPTTHTPAGDNVIARMNKVMRKYHGHLVTEKASVGVLMARNEDGEAVKVGGYPCAALVRKVSLKDRAAGLPDAQIIIDEIRWEELDDAEKDALLDHELEHLKIATDQNGQPKRDDLDRPKFNLAKHDAQIGIFRCVIERHGEKALDAQIAAKFVDEYGQLLLWAKDKETVG